ncbi:MAG: glycerol-3-phosphate 1-O-acyltransferase PlsY [Clostridia bacterium]|nr:glycerol-3-phosphate 1-O-acyltransferase PlsY [Clostridia bacterium]
MSIFELWTNGFLAQPGADNTVSYPIIPLFVGLIVAAMIIPYLLGSINSAIIISKLLYRDDVRRHGSGNAGMTNMLRTYGKGAAGLTLLGDLLKTVLAVACGSFTIGSSLGGWVACLFCMMGHIFPIFYKFRGGKGVLCAATGILILSPFSFLFAFLVFVILVATTRYVSLGSVVAGLMLPLFVNSYNQMFQVGGVNGLISVLIALIILWCHRENLKRISRREESKLSFGKKKDK